MAHRKICKALAPDLTEAEVLEAALEDYEQDLRGARALTLELYTISIFEIADLWTDSTEERPVESGHLGMAAAGRRGLLGGVPRASRRLAAPACTPRG